MAILVHTNTVKNLQQHIQNRLKSALGNLFYRRFKVALIGNLGKKILKTKIENKKTNVLA